MQKDNFIMIDMDSNQAIGEIHSMWHEVSWMSHQCNHSLIDIHNSDDNQIDSIDNTHSNYDHSDEKNNDDDNSENDESDLQWWI